MLLSGQMFRVILGVDQRFVASLSGLLCLLWWRLLGAAYETVHVGLVVDLLKHVLGSVPGLASSWRNILALSERITASTELLDHALHKSALADAGAEENGEESQNDPASLDEEDGRAKDAEPQCQLKASDERHTRVIVVLHEAAEGLSKAG